MANDQFMKMINLCNVNLIHEISLLIRAIRSVYVPMGQITNPILWHTEASSDNPEAQ